MEAPLVGSGATYNAVPFELRDETVARLEAWITANDTEGGTASWHLAGGARRVQGGDAKITKQRVLDSDNDLGLDPPVFEVVGAGVHVKLSGDREKTIQFSATLVLDYLQRT